MKQFNAETIQTKPKKSGPAHIIVFGNEKGGSGKSTAAMHTAIALLRLGYQVGTIDLDARQGTLTRYMRNRFEFICQTRKMLPSPLHMAIDRSTAATLQERETEEREFLFMALNELSVPCDFIVIDTPGTDSYLSRLAHSYAQTLVTPLNDSFVDLDLLADIDALTLQIKGPSIYTKMVEEQKTRKRLRDNSDIHWIVMRNRLSHLDAKNKQKIGVLLERMSGLYGFDIAPGFGERVTFRELFPKGLTHLDIKNDPETPMTLSQVAARQEVRHLITAIGPEKIRGYAQPVS